MAVVLKNKSFVYIETDDDYHISVVELEDGIYLELEDGSLIYIGDKEDAGNFFRAVVENFDL